MGGEASAEVEASAGEILEAVGFMGLVVGEVLAAAAFAGVVLEGEAQTALAEAGPAAGASIGAADGPRDLEAAAWPRGPAAAWPQKGHEAMPSRKAPMEVPLREANTAARPRWDPTVERRWRVDTGGLQPWDPTAGLPHEPPMAARRRWDRTEAQP